MEFADTYIRFQTKNILKGWIDLVSFIFQKIYKLNWTNFFLPDLVQMLTQISPIWHGVFNDDANTN